MSCNTCSGKFNIFSPERGCPLCGFSFCGKCLKYTAFVKKHNKTEKVCSKCKQLENGNTTNPEVGSSTPSTVRNAIAESATASSMATASCSRHNEPVIPDPDQQLAKRLQKLKDDVGENKESTGLTDDQIKQRLALLKGQNPAIATKPTAIVNTVDSRSDERKVDDMMMQFLEENEINQSRNNADDTLKERLNNLRGNEARHRLEMNRFMASDDEDEETEIQKIIRRYAAEGAIDSDSSKSSEDETEKERPDLDELPWCVICNENATLRCTDCTGDLYCRSCYKQSHREWNFPDHKTKPYKATEYRPRPTTNACL